MRAKLGALAVIATVALPSAAQGGAGHPHPLRAVRSLNPTGALTISWRGTQDRGCAQAGACGVSGLVTVFPESQLGSSESPPQHSVALNDPTAVARVRDAGGGTCADLVPVNITLGFVRRRDGRLGAVLDGAESMPSSGRCAGPTAGDLARMVLPARRVPGPNEAYDASGTETLGAGAYQVTLLSTLHVRRPPGPVPGGLETVPAPPAGPHARRLLLETLSITYRFRPTHGALDTEFEGRRGPACEPFDACGTNGMLHQRLTAAGGTLELIGSRVVRRPESRLQALHDLRTGRFDVFGGTGPVAAVLNETLGHGAIVARAERMAIPGCLAATGNELEMQGGQVGRTVEFSLQGVGLGDPWRTTCPGPSSIDIIGAANVLARGSMRLGDLGERNPRIVVSTFTRFRSGGYVGTTRGMVPFVLRLARVHVSTRRIKVRPGVPAFAGAPQV